MCAGSTSRRGFDLRKIGSYLTRMRSQTYRIRQVVKITKAWAEAVAVGSFPWEICATRFHEMSSFQSPKNWTFNAILRFQKVAATTDHRPILKTQDSIKCPVFRAPKLDISWNLAISELDVVRVRTHVPKTRDSMK